MVSLKAQGGNFFIRVDLLEIAAYLPRELKDGKPTDNPGTTIILNSGETLGVDDNPGLLDQMFAKNNLSLY